MQHLDAATNALMQGNALRYATLWTVKRADGTTFRYTDHSEVLTRRVPGSATVETFTPVDGFRQEAREEQDDFRGVNSEIEGAISATGVTVDDLRSGLYDGCVIEERVVDWRYTWAGSPDFKRYLVESIEFDGDSWRAELGSFARKLDRNIGRVYTRNCDADLGDGRCKFDLSTRTLQSCNVTSVVTGRVRIEFRGKNVLINASPYVDANGFYVARYHNLGRIVWLTGNNVGYETEVRIAVPPAQGATIAAPANDFSLDIKLQAETPFDIVAGDRFDLIPGCDKRDITCDQKFANIVNFRGNNSIPGVQASLVTP